MTHPNSMGLNWPLEICEGLFYISSSKIAALAQLVEHHIRNVGVGCSSHPCGTIFHSLAFLPFDFFTLLYSAKVRFTISLAASAG